MNYQREIANLPIPSSEQIERFKKHLLSAHSWYKHLDLKSGNQFVVFLEPDLDRNYTKHHIIYPWGINTEEDSSCPWDCHYSNLEDAYEMGTEYVILKDDWVKISDPLNYCQDDWIKPVRVIGRSNGNPEWGKFEQLIDGEWIKVN